MNPPVTCNILLGEGVLIDEEDNQIDRAGRYSS